MDQEIDHHQAKRLKITNPSIEFLRGQTIGHGSFAKVSLAKTASSKNSCNLPSIVAVKSCGVSHMASLAKERMVYEELKDCPEIVKCYGDSYTVEKGEKLYNVVLEYACGGSLAERVKNGLKMVECDVRKYLKSVLKGIKFVHDKGFVHCDVKLQNVLVFDGGVVKIADFGLAKKVEEKKATCEYEVRGTPLYLAPETVVGGVQEPASDIWAVGCLVSEMVSGLPAWTCADVSSLLMKIGVGAETPEIPGGLSDAGKDFLGKCFVKDPSKRWTAEMLLDHPFVKGEDCATSVSPRDPFDFPDWEMDQSVPVTPESDCWIAGVTRVLPEDRLRQLATTVGERPSWFDESGWITVR
ncbi:Protein kinase, ATP binding site-containing protein [Artemisia annua]|uniref:Protein kinase, ATP binding site-containing protein n=1 Tax=Artemisia annua TaxID=35608 RepID=A0A2U1NMI9_ARTAN|nr:Protein kinase, ATP binding site-containing protein [Artemisia annua]